MKTWRYKMCSDRLNVCMMTLFQNDFILKKPYHLFNFKVNPANQFSCMCNVTPFLKHFSHQMKKYTCI